MVQNSLKAQQKAPSIHSPAIQFSSLGEAVLLSYIMSFQIVAARTSKDMLILDILPFSTNGYCILYTHSHYPATYFSLLYLEDSNKQRAFSFSFSSHGVFH